jgi:3-phosphoshikimate 1-carboxyvinyltransferase
MDSNPLMVQGKLQAGAYAINGGVSSQFISGLLFALPLLRGNSHLTVTGKAESVPYIDMTLDAIARVTRAVEGTLPDFSIAGRDAHAAVPADETAPPVGGDWSGAAFFLTAGLLTPEGSAITVEGVDVSSRQGDRAIIDVLTRMGGRFDVRERSVVAHASYLHGCEIDATQIPDLVPILAVAASVAEGETRITGAARLRLKESDRLMTVSAMLTALGGDVTEAEDGLIIHGKPYLTGGVVDAAGDHRIAMSAAIAATVCQGVVTVCGAEVVAKSYPAFWRDFEALQQEETTHG